jgi:hypothetical protein
MDYGAIRNVGWNPHPTNLFCALGKDSQGEQDLTRAIKYIELLK